MSGVGIIGLGNVGINLAAALIETESVDKLLINSRNIEKSESYKMDLEDLSSCYEKPTAVKVSSLDEMIETDLVVIAVRADFKNTQSTDIRTVGLFPNAGLIKDIAKRFKNYTGNVLMVTNPVDIMSRVFFEVAGLNENYVYGLGSNLCTQRYRLMLSQLYNVPLTKIEGQVIGEHGDSRVILCSSTKIDGKTTDLDEEGIAKWIAGRSPSINKGAGRTRYGPIGVAVRTIRKFLGSKGGVEQLSSYFNGLYIGVPILFDKGKTTLIFPEMSHAESLKFETSYSKLMGIYNKLKQDI